MNELMDRMRFRMGLQCADCKLRGAPMGLLICAGGNPWYCANR